MCHLLVIINNLLNTNSETFGNSFDVIKGSIQA